MERDEIYGKMMKFMTFMTTKTRFETDNSSQPLTDVSEEE